MEIRTVLKCEGRKKWRLFGKFEVRRCPLIGETITLGFVQPYTVVGVNTDLNKDEIFLDFAPLPQDQFVFVKKADHKQNWKFESGGDKEEKAAFQSELTSARAEDFQTMEA